MSHYYSVAVPRPIRKQFTYKSDESNLKPGCLVKVPFGKSSINGVITDSNVRVDSGFINKIKPIEKAYSSEPLLNKALLSLTRWMGEYYLCSWGEAIFNALPTFPKKPVDIEKKEQCFLKADFKKDLTEDQSRALDVFKKHKSDGKPFLIHGVAGCGKTEIYLRIAAEVLQAGKNVIYLVPEISLINQIGLFVEEVFPGQAVYFHSKQTPKERLESWCQLKRGEKRIVVGPRSALFAPFDNVGLIILDEEHDDSYKQDETPRYHALRTACKRAEIEGAHLILGSATPSLDSLEYAKEGKMHLITIQKRISEMPSSDVQLVDLKRNKRSGSYCLSEILAEKIQSRLEKKEGVLIFLNRRGYSTQVKCQECGHYYTCPHCDVALTYHQEDKKLICHYCRYALKPAFKCPECGKQLSYSGFGTEKIESEIARLFPDAVIERIDRETVQRRGNLETVLDRFRKEEIDILIGTQMLSKGLDFKHLTLVGVLIAEGNLQLPDFRAAERTYQLLEQVAGRSGRGETKGEVIVQTYLPEHYSIQAVLRKNPKIYIENELRHRKEYSYPPFKQMINLTFRGRKEESVIQASEKFTEELIKRAEKCAELPEILGPAPLPFYRLRGYYRWHLMIKGDNLDAFKAVLSETLGEIKKSFGVYIEIDIDPIQIL